MRHPVAIAAATVLGVAVIAAGVTTLARSSDQQPITFRFWKLGWLPGWSTLAQWEARRDARRNHQEGRHILFGYGESGTDLGDLGCEVVEYERGEYLATDVPSWINVLMAGAAEVRCQDGILHSFIVIEVGAVVTSTGYDYGFEYNQRAVTLARSEGRTPNHALKLTVRAGSTRSLMRRYAYSERVTTREERWLRLAT